MADTPTGGPDQPSTPGPTAPAPTHTPAPGPAPTEPPGPAPVPAPGPGPASGPGQPYLMPGRGVNRRQAVVLILVILLIAGCAVAMLFTLGESLGLVALLVGLVAAILPVPVLVACFLWLDRYEPEPTRYLVLSFAWGASVATYASLNVNQFAADLFQGQGLPDALVAVLVAPFIEELTKALFPIALLVFRRREFSGVTDGIVYCGLSAIGFAMVENILYLGGHGYASGVDQYGPATGAQNVVAIFIVRILFTGFAHPLFTSMTGIGIGVAARAADRRVRVLAPLAGLLLAMMLHGAWNLMPSLAVATGQNLILLYGYIGVMVPIFFGMVGFAVWLRSWEGRLTERRLPDYVRAGWFSPPEVAALSSLGRRHSARCWAQRVAGHDGRKAMLAYQYAATRLALIRDGILRGLETTEADLARVAAEEQRLLAAITAYRQVFTGRDPQAPPGLWDGHRYHLIFPDGVRRTLDAPDEPVVPIPVVLTAPPASPPPVTGPQPGAYPHWPAPSPGWQPGER